MNTIIIRYAEIALKGGNRIAFEKRLGQNIRDCFKKNKKELKQVVRIRGRIYIETNQKCPKLAHVFGISSFSNATKLEFDIDHIKKTIDRMLPKDYTTFRMSAHRINKVVPMNSQEINIALGQYIVDKYQKKVKLKGWDLDVGVEIHGKDAYVYMDRTPGPGGLPLGVNGRAVALIENKWSQLAAWYLMRRGVAVIPVSKKKTDITIIMKYSYGTKPRLEIGDASEFAKSQGIDAIITGRTLSDFKRGDDDLLYLEPLIGLGDVEDKIRELECV